MLGLVYRRLVKEGRLLCDGDGNNTDTRLNFRPTMDATRLVEGYRSILARIYDRDAYYARVRTFLERYRPSHHYQRSWSDYVAFARSLLWQGVLGRGRRAYWRFLFDAATRYRRALGTAVTLAIMGHHLRLITEGVCDARAS